MKIGAGPSSRTARVAALIGALLLGPGAVVATTSPAMAAATAATAVTSCSNPSRKVDIVDSRGFHTCFAGTGYLGLRPAPGKSSWLRIRVTRLAYEPRTALGSRVGITDLRIPGVRAVRTISVPDTGTGDPGTVLLTKRGDADACMRGSVTWTCSSRLQILGEDGYGFDRLIPVARDGVRTVRGQAVLTDPKAADLITTLPNQYPHVSASSTAAEHGAVLGRQAMDGDPSTLWYAQPFDRHPTLSIDLGRTRTFSRIRVLFPDSAQGIPPVKLTLRAGAALTEARAVQGWVDRDGVFTFPTLKTRKFTIEFTAPASRAIEVAEIAIPGVKPLGGLGAIPLRLP